MCHSVTLDRREQMTNPQATMKTGFDATERQSRRTASAFALRSGALPGSDAYRKAYLEHRASLAQR